MIMHHVTVTHDETLAGSAFAESVSLLGCFLRCYEKIPSIHEFFTIGGITTIGEKSRRSSRISFANSVAKIY
jgi:hypothetical protein